MRLYRMIGKNDNDYGFAEIHGPQTILPGGLWRPATRAEYIYHQLFRHRFSYVDLTGILIVTSIVAWLDLPLWFFVLLTIPLVMIVLFLEKRFR